MKKKRERKIKKKKETKEMILEHLRTHQIPQKMKLLMVKTEEMEKIQETKEMKEKQMMREEIKTMEMNQVKDLNLDLKQLLPPSL